jgi:UDP-N-acetylglucosamine transferase subunit ALG13
MDAIAESMSKAKKLITEGYAEGKLTEEFLLFQQEKYTLMFNHYNEIGTQLTEGVEWVEKNNTEVTPEQLAELRNNVNKAIASTIHCASIVKHIDELLGK